MFHDHHKQNNFFLKDLKWQSLDIIEILNFDLEISSSFLIKRQYPFENIALRLTELQNQNKQQMLNNILSALSARNNKESESLYSDLFRNCQPQIFGILGNNFEFWVFVINAIKLGMVVSNKQILNSFQNNLQKQINRMLFAKNKLNSLFDLIRKLPQIFDTVNIRLCLLRNAKLIAINDDNSKPQLRGNIQNILKIILVKKTVGNTVRSELIIFATKLLQDRHSKNTALTVMGRVLLHSNNENLQKIFKTVLNKVVCQNYNVPERISMFMECTVFYEYVSVHRYFIQIVMNGNNKEIHLWNHNQINQIQNLITKHAKPQNKAAIKLWSGILMELIVLPQYIAIEQNNDNSDSDMDTESDTDIIINEEDGKQDEKYNYDDGGEPDGDGDAELIHNLKYCVSMHKWLLFAVKNKHIEPFNALIKFVLLQLRQLNDRITKKEINMECLELINQHNMKQLVADCQYNQYNHKQYFNHKQLDSMIQQLSDWNVLSQHFRTFLNKFTKTGDKIIKIQSQHKIKTFLRVLKDDWNTQKYLNMEKREEWMNWLYPNNKKLKFINDIQQSQVFFYIWWKRRDNLDDGTKMDLNTYLKTLYKQSKSEWDNLVKRASRLQLTFDDKRYFEDFQLIQELQSMKLEEKTVQKIQKDMSDSLKLEKYVEFVEYLIEIVHVFIEYGHTKIDKLNDKNWEQLNQNLNTAKFKKNDKNQNISEAAGLYRDIKGTVNQTYRDSNKQWIKTMVHCKETINKLANEEHYQINRFSETLQIIDDFSTDGQMVQLSGSLRSIYQQCTHIWQQSFPTKIHLMRHFAAVQLKRNDISNLLDVHENEIKIKQIVCDAGKMAQQRDMEKLDQAMSNGYFAFAKQKNIEQSVHDSNQSETDIIASKCFTLYFESNKERQKMSCNQMQDKIDIILLCRKTNIDHDHVEQDEKKMVLDDDDTEDKQDVSEYIRKLEICKEISLLRVEYIMNGGRMGKKLANAKLTASASLDDFNDLWNEWKNCVAVWSDYIFELRTNSHLFNYFTINKIRIIIGQLNKYNVDTNTFEHIKEHKSNADEIWACHVCTFANALNSVGCNMCNTPNPFYVTPQKPVISPSCLFEQLLSHFRFINAGITEDEFRAHLEDWRYVDANSTDALEYFHQYFSAKKRMNIVSHLNNHREMKEKPKEMKEKPKICKDKYKSYKSKNFNAISNGQPNLIIAKSEKNAMFSTLKLYYNMHTLSIPSNQILICNERTTFEHIHIFILRCLQTSQRFESMDPSSIPLFCLLFPEYLNFSVVDKTIEIFDKYLLSKNQQTKRYSFVVISCKENCNRICDVLSQFKINDISSMFTDKHSKKICNNLFNGKDGDILKQNKLFVQLYDSQQVGIGKSFKIYEKAAVINKQANKSDNIIRIPVNSSNINLDFIINRLYQCYDGIERNKIIYHIDISPAASESINILLFNLLFLNYVSTTKHECFSVSSNMAFLIELPTKLASLHTKDHQIKDEFYLLHSPIQFARKHIDSRSNPFRYNDSTIHYAAKFLQHFFSDELKTNDPNPIHQKVNEIEIKQVMAQRFANSLRSPIHQQSIWRYLYTQFQQVVHSTPLSNEWYRDYGGFKHWKHLTTESIIDLAEDFSKKLYDDDGKYYDNDDESTGTEHFHLTQKWQNQKKPIVLLNQSCFGSISFLVVDKNIMDEHLKNALVHHKFNILGWQQQDQNQSKEEKIRLLLTILGTYDDILLIELAQIKPYCDYALTFDNMLKMIAIFFRIKANIPVILMGETGCGKTALLTYLAKAAKKDIQRADVHGGFRYEDLKNKMIEWIKIANKKRKDSQEMLQLKVIQQTGEMKEGEYKDRCCHDIEIQHEMLQSDNLYIFFDEINTSPDIGCFKEILCDGYFDGEPLPTNMKIIAACNPYRKRKLKKQKTVVYDSLSEYVYRVYPLPSTMKEYIWMFGSLSKNDEKAYAHQMCQTFTDKILNDKQKRKLSQTIVISQEFIRKTLKDSAFVSLRDIARCLKIFVYSYQRSNNFNDSMIEALALVYYFRLNYKNRYLYNKTLSQNGVRGFYSTLQGTDGVIDKICALFRDVIHRGIALNKSLRENLFLLFTCIQTKTSLILVGNPGSSKTLAMSIIKNYMADKAGKEVQMLTAMGLKPIHVISFQCSTQSKSEGIRERWDQTVKFAEENKDIISVLLLDEIGLAEHSKHRPLKVLHQLLEIDPAPIAFIGLSNWNLDAAKMNRAIMHLCPKHKIEDLTQTATAMAEQYVTPKRLNKIKTKLKVLSYVYKDITVKNNKLQPRSDFFGARDFYAVVKHFLTGINRNDDSELIMYLLRNFGGINYQNNDDKYSNDEHNSKRKELFKIIEKHMPLKNKNILKDTVNEYRPIRLIALNLADKRSTHTFDDSLVMDNFIISRHVMVISEYINSWTALLDLNVIDFKLIFIFGSEFERDKTNNIYLHLNRVKQTMETGKTLILCNLDEINESLYDMLNQRYTFIKNSGKMYCRIALGSNSQTCFVDPAFKCIVITTKTDAHSDGGVPIAFINRFEKQLISYHSSLLPQHLRFLYKLRAEICDMYCLNNMIEIYQIFPGFCGDTFASLILNVIKPQLMDDQKMHYNDNDDGDSFMQNDGDSGSSNDDYDDIHVQKENVMKECCNHLLNVTLTESLIQCTVNNKGHKRKRLVEYLPSLQQLIFDNKEPNKLLIVLTFDFENKLNKNKNAQCFEKTIFKKMSNFSKSEQFEKYMYRYLTAKDGLEGNDNLLLQYRHNNMNHFIHIKHIIESKMHIYNANKRVTLLVHLHRNEDLHKQFPLIFTKYSKIVFLDSLAQKHPIPLDSFVNHSICDVCNERGIDLLRKTFQRALSHLDFNQNIDIEYEVNRVSNLLSNNSAIQRLIFDRFLKLLSQNKINRNIGDVVCKSISNFKSWKRGSFYERLHDIIDTIGVVAMIHILQTLYINFNVDILQNENQSSIVKIFVLLYQSDLIEDKVLDINVENILEDKPNKLFVKTDFNAKFPFSDIIHSWCNSIKCRIINNGSGDSRKRKLSDDDVLFHDPPTKKQRVDGDFDDIKYHYDSSSDSDQDEFDNDNDIDMKWDEPQMDAVHLLKQELSSTWPPSVCEVSFDVSEKYAHDLILLNGHKLQINQSFSSELIDLSARLLVIVALNSSQMTGDQQLISIAALETAIWNKEEFIRHLIGVLKVLDVDPQLHRLVNIKNMISFDSSIVYAVDMLLENMLNWLDDEMYQQCNLHSTPDSIKYIIEQIGQEIEENDNNNYQHFDALHSKFIMIKIKRIALKFDLSEMDNDVLYGIVNVKVTLFDYDLLSQSLQYLTNLIKKDTPTEKLCNQILYELLKLIEDSNIDQQKENHILKYAQFLIDVLCKLDTIIEVDNADLIKWDQATEDKIVGQLFAVLSRDALQSKKIIQQIQHTNNKLAGMIIQIMERNKNQKEVDRKIEYAKSEKDFDKRLNIITPLIKEFNTEIYERAIIFKVKVESFLAFFKFGKKSFPILLKLKQQNRKFWHLNKLTVIGHWIQLIQSKYMGAISESGCNKLKMKDVLEQCKLNKWGDQNEWKQLLAEYKNAMNAISINNTKLPDLNHNIPLSISLIAKHGNAVIRNNLKSIQNMIDIQNNFVNVDQHLTLNCNFFDLTQNELINTTKILDIIQLNTKPWICYDSQNELAPKIYLTFNFKRIENEIKEQCVNGRKRLKIKYRNFQCIGSKNMLRLIQSLRINQEILDYETWHLFDKQFESNIQRKKALNIIEDVLRLLSNAKIKDNNENDKDFVFDAMDIEEDKEDEKYNNNMAEINNNPQLCQFMQNTLKLNADKCEIFNIANKNRIIQLKHIQSVWQELVKRIDGEMVYYNDQCYVCYESIAAPDLTPMEMECRCQLKLHYGCLKRYIKNGLGKKGSRIFLKELSCLMCKQALRHKAAKKEIADVQILRDKLEKVALDQLKEENKLNDAVVINKDGEFYNKPSWYAMKIYAFYLCYDCTEPYFYGPAGCAGNGADNVRPEQFVCIPCYDKKMEILRRENAQQYAQWAANNGIKPCPGGCGQGLQKISGCNFIQCPCGTGVCWQTGLIAGRGGGTCGGGHACHF